MFRRNLEHSLRREAGFTLVEMMAVLVIVGLASALVVMTLPPPQTDAEKAAERLATMIERAADEAVVSGNMIGVRVDARGYEFQRWRGGAWLDLPGFEGDGWPRGVSVSVGSESLTRDQAAVNPADDTPPPPVIRFDTTGAVTPFRIVIRGPRDRFVLTGDGGARFALERSDVRA